jgi:hypothetical protein
MVILPMNSYVGFGAMDGYFGPQALPSGQCLCYIEKPAKLAAGKTKLPAGKAKLAVQQT